MRKYRRLKAQDWRAIDAVLMARAAIPAIKELAAKYGVAVGTIRNRMTRLREQGVRVR